MAGKLTRKAYVAHLNEVELPAQGSEKWIIGGKIRMSHMWTNRYGEAIRSFDKIAFEVGYQEWERENS